MPTYSYTCDACNYIEEVHHGIKSSVVRTCPDCKTQKLRKLISAVPSHFKGKGWSVDLYA